MINAILPNQICQNNYFMRKANISSSQNLSFKNLLDAQVVKGDSDDGNVDVKKMRRNYNTLIFILSGIIFALVAAFISKK